VGFFWNRAQFVVCTDPNAPKVRALATNPKVALNTFPPHVLLVRGTASIEVIEGVPPEYLEGAKKMVGAQVWQGFEAQVRISPSSQNGQSCWTLRLGFKVSCAGLSRGSKTSSPGTTKS
jgi:hypothetical protein